MPKTPYPIGYKPLKDCPHCDGDLLEKLRVLKKRYVKIVYYCLRCGRRCQGRSERLDDINEARKLLGLKTVHTVRTHRNRFVENTRYKLL